MAVVDDPKTFGRARLSFANEADIDEFVDDARAVRARRDHARPVARVPAACAAPTASGRPTTRRCCASRFRRACSTGDAARRARRRRRAVLARLRPHHHAAEHPVPLRQAARRRAGDAAARRRGLTTREACGNSVRNITAARTPASPRDELFDVTPYAEAMTRYLLRHPLSSTLPRKFKIAFEGCADDHVAHADQRPRLPRGDRARTAAARLPRHRRRRHGDHVPSRARRCTSSCRRPRSCASPKRCCACSSGSATTSTSSATG